jgi:DNA-binding PadR family transcriptional regulator
VAKRGDALELAVLGLLHEAPMHGYELRKRVTGLLGWGRVLSYGSLYPCLKQMLRDGLIT